MTEKIRICFVCLGNIVRSPLAENMFRHLADRRGVGDSYEVDSAGTGSWHIGEPPDPRMQKVAARHGLRYRGQARQFRSDDFDRFDWIIAMDRDNQDVLSARAPTRAAEAKIRLMREFDPDSGPNASVPDPYYGGLRGFEEVYFIIERACNGLLDSLEAGDQDLNK